MNNEWFECKVRYDKTMETGLLKKVTETYVVEALSFTEAERRFIEEMRPLISGEFIVTDIKRAKLTELFESIDAAADRWFKAKVAYITLDEVSGAEARRVRHYHPGLVLSVREHTQCSFAPVESVLISPDVFCVSARERSGFCLHRFSVSDSPHKSAPICLLRSNYGVAVAVEPVKEIDRAEDLIVARAVGRIFENGTLLYPGHIVYRFSRSLLVGLGMSFNICRPGFHLLLDFFHFGLRSHRVAVLVDESFQLRNSRIHEDSLQREQRNFELVSVWLCCRQPLELESRPAEYADYLSVRSAGPPEELLAYGCDHRDQQYP